MASVEEKRKESVERMKLLRMNSLIIKDFEDKNILNCFNNGRIDVLTSKQLQLVKDIENRFNCIVYHTIMTDTDFGLLFSMLLVSNYDKEWEYEKQLLEKGNAVAWVENLTDDTLSEMGMIGVKCFNGMLYRTY